jgi:predicted secreted Zn-dependent protease
MAEPPQPRPSLPPGAEHPGLTQVRLSLTSVTWVEADTKFCSIIAATAR